MKMEEKIGHQILAGKGGGFMETRNTSFVLTRQTGHSMTKCTKDQDSKSPTAGYSGWTISYHVPFTLTIYSYESKLSRLVKREKTSLSKAA